MKDILVSVVVPIFNVQDYLKHCLNSIAMQTYKNIQVILVNDGSADDSGFICDEFCSHDNRFTVIHKKNGGSSSAREAGLKSTIGDYVMFLDGDDWLDLNTIEECINIINNRNYVDLILFSYMKELPGRSIPMHVMDHDMELHGVEAEEKIFRRLFGLSSEELAHPERMENIVSCCMKLYRKDLAKAGRFFDTNMVGSCEDGLFNMYALSGVTEAVYIDKPMYHYRKTNPSLTRTYRPKLVSQWKSLFHIMQEIIKEKGLGSEYDLALNNRISLSIVGIGLNELENPDHTFIGHIREMKKYLNQCYFINSCKNMDISNMPISWKSLMIFSKLKLSVLVFMMIKAMDIIRKR